MVDSPFSNTRARAYALLCSSKHDSRARVPCKEPVGTMRLPWRVMMKHIWAVHVPIKFWPYPIGPSSDIIIPSSPLVQSVGLSACPHPLVDIDPREPVHRSLSPSFATIKRWHSWRLIQAPCWYKDCRNSFVRFLSFSSNETSLMFQRPCPPVGSGCAAEWYSE